MADDAPATTPVTTAADDAAADTTDSTAAVDTAAADTTTSVDGDTSSTAEGADGDSNVTDDTDAGDGSTTAPDSYADFTLPEGVELDAAVLESAAPVMKEAGLTQEQSQKFVDWYAKQVQAGAEKQVEAFNQLTSQWKTDSENDKDFGGDKFEESVGLARSAIDKFGTPGLKQLLSDHGVGNHPEVVRFMVRVGQLTKEDNPGSGGDQASEKKDHADILYPKKSA